MRTGRRWFIGAAAVAAAAGSAVAGDELSLDFENTTASMEFTLGSQPFLAMFTGGTVGPAPVANSGTNGWILDAAGQTLFFTPGQHVTLVFRDVGGTSASTVRVIAADGSEIESFTGKTDAWVTVDVSIDPALAPAIGRIEVTPAAGGTTVVDDLGLAVVPQPAPITNPIEEGIPRSPIALRLETVAAELTAPNWGTSAPGDPGRLYVTDQNGVVWKIDLGTGAKTEFLNVQARLVPLGISGPGSFDERGLLGLAFHPDYATNGLLYTYESHPAGGTPDFSTMPPGVAPNHQTVIAEWRVPDPTNPDAVVDPSTARTLLRIDEPQFNHNAGALAFGPDRMLYIALGDGGAGDDQGNGHGVFGNGRNTDSILGKILRIDPLGTNSANGQYGVPADNPFVNADGLDEIWAYGFRNPFRFSFDRQSGELWVGDVGQNQLEEVNIVTRGGNYGWNWKEGTHFFHANGTQRGYVHLEDPGVPPGLIDPVAQYDHDEGVAVVGGFVYRGSTIPELAGRYVFGDFDDNGRGRLFHLDDQNRIFEFRYAGDAFALELLGFGEDAAGELYALANATGTPFETTGVVLRLVGACAADWDGDGSLTFADFTAFRDDYAAGSLDADFNGDGQLTLSDFVAFRNAYVTTCP